MIRALVMTLLDDDSGISKDAWEALTEYLQCQGEFELLGELARKVEIAEGGGSVPAGRYFIDRDSTWKQIASWGEFHFDKTTHAK